MKSVIDANWGFEWSRVGDRDEGLCDWIPQIARGLPPDHRATVLIQSETTDRRRDRERKTHRFRKFLVPNNPQANYSECLRNYQSSRMRFGLASGLGEEHSVVTA